MVFPSSLFALGLLVAPGVLGHPGHDIREEAAERREFLKRSPNTVRSCIPQLERRGYQAAALERRQQMAHEARVKRGLADRPLVRRDFKESLETDHESTSDVTLGSDERLLFADNSTCLLQPEVTQGPYYVDGELIRSDISEDQIGVPLYLDIQLVDTSNCLPVPAVFMDIWHCNSTGVYSGVTAKSNGNGNDTSNLEATFLRGIQQTDVNGVAQFESIFPGHYTGRATHIHVLAHNTNDTTIRTNGTLLSGNFTAHASHSGQIFFDQDLISQVEATASYKDNQQVLTTNAEDYLFFEEAAGMDPVMEYVLLGDDITDGIMAWISIGIDPTTDNDVVAAAAVYSDSGEMNPNPPPRLGLTTPEEHEIQSSLKANAPKSTPAA
jgi:protocatechuate 3,4-dioxygenase beta subunit